MTSLPNTITRWIPFGFFLLLVGGFLMWAVWPRWWAALALVTLAGLLAFARRELERRHPDAFTVEHEHPEDRTIVFYNEQGKEIHRIGPHFAIPGCRSTFTVPLAVSRMEIVDPDDPGGLA